MHDKAIPGGMDMLSGRVMPSHREKYTQPNIKGELCGDVLTLGYGPDGGSVVLGCAMNFRNTRLNLLQLRTYNPAHWSELAKLCWDFWCKATDPGG